MEKRYKKKQEYNSFIEYGKIPPSAVDFEIFVLGAILYEGSIISDIVEMLKPETFYKQAHQIIYTAIRNLYKRKDPIDILTVSNELKNMRKLEEVGGPYYVTTLTNGIFSTATVEYKIRILQQKFFQRELIRFCTETIRDAFDDTTDPFKLLDNLKANLEEIDNLGGEKVSIETMRNVATKTIDQLLFIVDNQVNTYYKTGSKQLDKHLKISPDNSLLLGGKSGAGKTRLLTFIISLLLRKYDDIAVLWYTMEDKKQKLLRCFISQDVKLSDEELLGINYTITEDDRNAIIAISGKFNDYDVEFCDDAKTMQQIAVHFKKFCKNRPDKFNFLIVDNLMQLEDQSEKKQQTAIDDQISREIIKLRKETNKKGKRSFIISLHHFTEEQMKELNLKEGYRPRENHFKGSTRLRDANTIIALLNKPGEFSDLVSQYKGYEEILKSLFLLEITKHRDGKMYDDNVMRFFGTLDYNIFIDI